jgi:hypothetical protein
MARTKQDVKRITGKSPRKQMAKKTVLGAGKIKKPHRYRPGRFCFDRAQDFE